MQLSNLQFLLSLLAVAVPAALAQPSGGGGGPPGGGPPGGGGGGGGGGALTVPDGVNLLCDNPDAQQDCLACTLKDTPSDPLLDTRRRRYEVRDMPADNWESFVFGMQEMKTLSMEEGKIKYGPLFKTQDYVVALHATASKSARGDQGHFGSQFMGFHSAFCLMVETTLLQIADVAGRNFTGIPYYWTLDSDAGDVLTSEYYGTHPGLGDGYEITDGPFANWTITKDFSISDYSEFITNMTDNGFPDTGNFYGFLRSTANNASNPFMVAYPYVDRDLGFEVPYSGFDYDTVLECLETPYNATSYTLFHFTYCINDWHNSMHASIGSRASDSHEKYNAETMLNTEGDLTDVDTSPNAPVFTSFHSTIDMMLREWASRYPEGVSTTWGLPYAESYSYSRGSVVDGANGNDVVTSTWPMTWADLGWAETGSTEGQQYATHAQVHCKLAKENADYVYVRYSGAPNTAPGIPVFANTTVISNPANDTYITGTIYCDNYFKFYFNGELIAEDPMTFIPHQAVEVAFEWDGVSDKEYAILCQDFATSSGYEYTESTRTGLGDGALVAAFSDGTRTFSDWSTYVVTYGPTEESEAAGCSATNLDVCAVADYGLPDNWFAVGFDFADWDNATVYTSDEAGWGRTPTWVEGVGCCSSISPLTGETLTTNNGCSVNYDIPTGQEVAVDVDESGCIDPKAYFDTGEEYSDAAFIWGSSLQYDNQMLFRYTVKTTTESTLAPNSVEPETVAPASAAPSVLPPPISPVPTSAAPSTVAPTVAPAPTVVPVAAPSNLPISSAPSVAVLPPPPTSPAPSSAAPSIVAPTFGPTPTSGSRKNKKGKGKGKGKGMGEKRMRKRERNIFGMS